MVMVRRVTTWCVSDHETAIRQGARVMVVLGTLCLMNLIWYGASGLGFVYLALTGWLAIELWRGKLGVAVWMGRFAALVLAFFMTAQLLALWRQPVGLTLSADLISRVAGTAIFGACLGYLVYLLCHPSVIAAWTGRGRRESLHWGFWLAAGAVCAGGLYWLSIDTPWYLVEAKRALVLAGFGVVDAR